MNKKGIAPIAILAIIIGGLLLINIIGLSTTIIKLSSNKPILYLLLGVGIIILIKRLKK